MTKQIMIKLLLTDDHPIVRKGLIHVLEQSARIEVIGEAESGEEALFLCQKLAPDVVVMDVQMKGIGGIEATRILRQQHPDLIIIGLSTFPQTDIATKMMNAGANGYLLKDISSAELISSIQQIFAGDKIVSDDLVATSLGPNPSSHDSMPDGVSYALGRQQKKVLMLMTKGLTNPEIAEHLGVSMSTARYHVSAVLQKLDVSNRSEAVALAMRHRLVDESDI